LNHQTLKPARAFLGSGRLLFDAHFEIQGIAVKP
jgi:enamine deaminase RidA (YjgF/YER057c/UK114 family)